MTSEMNNYNYYNDDKESISFEDFSYSIPKEITSIDTL